MYLLRSRDRKFFMESNFEQENALNATEQIRKCGNKETNEKRK